MTENRANNGEHLIKLIGIASLLFALLFANSITTSANIQDFVNYLNFDFISNNVLNVTTQNDYMTDTNGNSIGDTLNINITTDAATPGNYMFFVDLEDSNGIVVNTTNKTIDSNNKIVVIPFSTDLLSGTKFNYTLRIYDANEATIFRKHRIPTQTYPNYEVGINVTTIIDGNVNNNLIRINLTVNSTKAITTNATVFLKFNQSSIVSTKEVTLSTGVQVVSLDFDNESIKSTHYNGKYLIDAVNFNDKVIKRNYTTSVYNYETFAKTTYIQSFSDALVDLNANNLTDFVDVNVTFVVKAAGSYTLDYQLFDQFDQFVGNVSKAVTLSVGTQTINTKVNGSDIYKSKIDGPYLITSARLSDTQNNTIDIVPEPRLMNVSSFTNFERPPLPDLIAQITTLTINQTNTTNVTITVKNTGSAAALNIFVDVFDNANFADNASINFLDVGSQQNVTFNATSLLNASNLIGIVDFFNLVDETGLVRKSTEA